MYNPRKPQYTLFTVREATELLPFVMKALDGISRSKAKAILSGGGVRVDRRNVSQHDFPLTVGMKVEISKQKQRFHFQSKYLKIVYEDAQIIVIEKNIGILSMASTQGQLCVKSILDDYFHKTRQKCAAHVVHRLDRDTSGVLVLGKNRAVLAGFQALMQAGGVEKRYLCLVDGHWNPATREVRLRLAKAQLQGGERMVVGAADGQEARTRFRLLQTFADASLLEATLDTGRTHQIRVSVQHRGHGIAGDDKYGKREFNRVMRKLGYKGMFLHAASIAFPYDTRAIQAEAPLPAPAAHLLTHLQQEIV